MNLDTTWGTLARAAGGRLTRGGADDPVSSISTDTRKLSPDQAFWALKGPRYDAHVLLNRDLAGKCSGWIVERGRLPSDLGASHVVEVNNTLKALQAFAAHHRRRFDVPVVGITGSNGKTTTKEMLKTICELCGPTCSSPGNWNNQVGVPLSVLEMTREHRYGVFELADSHPGDIDEVAKVAQPTLAVLTNIGPDHLEFYGGMEANFKTKAELIENLPPEGLAVVNCDDPWLAGLEPRLGSRAVTFGMAKRAKVSFAEDGVLMIDRTKVSVKLQGFGALSRYNAAAAAAAAWSMGIPVEKIRQGLEAYRPSAMRLERLKLPSGCEVVLDAYNANPASMKAAIEGFCQEYGKKEKVLVLGDMKELGEGSSKFHAELGEWLSTLPLSSVYLAGPEMSAAQAALAARKPKFPVSYAESPAGWNDKLRGELTPDRALFFKASRSMRFESILESLQCSTR
jgi:UDP-N-acetylmuramoyl-tripeptide--D-alanyl-D-alanine ligase